VAIWSIFSDSHPSDWTRESTKPVYIEYALDLLSKNAQLLDRLREHHRRSESESNVKKIARVQKQRAQRQAEYLQHTSCDPTVQEYEYLGLPETASMACCLAAYRQATVGCLAKGNLWVLSKN